MSTKKVFLTLSMFVGFLVAFGQPNAWINEFHYDNSGTDAGEFVEVVIENVGSYTLSDFVVYLYNGNGGALYGTHNLSTFTLGSTSGDFSIYHKAIAGIQNGGTPAEPSSDGIALTHQSILIPGQFLSYEGSFTATGAPLTGATSTDILVDEDPAPAAGNSLQLSGTGSQYVQFAWQAPADDTPGQLNNSQTFSLAAVGNPTGFNALAISASQINLSWTLNGSSDSVMIAWNSTHSFGTPSGIYSIGNTISGSGTVLYKGLGTAYNHTGLQADSAYFYKAWSFNASHSYSSGVIDSASTLDTEPSNYPEDFAAATNGIQIELTWAETSGTVIPDFYLLKISDADNITTPTDGIFVTNDIDLTDGTGAYNVAAGTETYTFYWLQGNTTYYSKIFPYTTSGSYQNPNYKSDGTVPSASATTKAVITTNRFETTGFGTWTTYSVSNDTLNWINSSSGGGALGSARKAQMNGYSSAPATLSNDWLISPALNLDNYSGDQMLFYSLYSYSSPDTELTMKYSTNYAGGNPTAAAWTDISFAIPATADTWLSSGTLDLSGISGTSVYIAFQYLNTSRTVVKRWNVDEIAITGNGVSDPSNFNATALNQSQIDLTWALNGSGNNVLIAWNSSNTFGSPTGTYVVDNPIFGGGTVIYYGSGTSVSHTGLTGNTTYYYKAWSYDGSSNYSSGVTDNALTFIGQPSNHPTNFTATANGPTSVIVTWDDSDAEKYLIKGSAVSYAAITPPVDYVSENNSTLVRNVTDSVETYQFTGLIPDTTYYFKIYPYNGSGTTVNYKTDGTVPQDTAATPPLGLDLFISEVAAPNDSSRCKFVEIYNSGATTIDFSTITVYLSKQSNGGTAWGDLPLSGTVASNSTFVVAANTTAFQANYNVSPNMSSGIIDGNGNDGYFLYYNGSHTEGYRFDSYGVVGENGTGKPWEYTQTHAVRKRDVLSPNRNWTANEWVIIDSANFDNMTPTAHREDVFWTGNYSSEWNSNRENWNSTNWFVPDASFNVTIYAGTPNAPEITEPAACNTITIEDTATLVIQGGGGKLTVVKQ